jgi:Xaa-Pro aminopeptidase
MAEGLAALGILRGSASDLMETGAVATFYPHGLGHLLGLDVHDMEDLGDRAGYGVGRERSEHPCFRALRLDRDLEAGMVVTIEPGFYRSPLLLARAREDAVISERINWAVLDKYNDVSGIRIEDDILVTSHGAEVLSAEAPKTPTDIENWMAGSPSG